ncbi:MAG TPA: SLC13 family permease [Blastocatellia bacterium]|nr:SLC13 family permease [Blastocatellia bacterium]
MESLFSFLPLQGVVTLLILAAAIYAFVRETMPPDVVSLLAIIALLLTGVLTPMEAFSGFSHPATVSVAAVLVLSASVERTGVLAVIARRLLSPLGGSELLLTAIIMLVIGTLSAFINNTAAVGVFIPIVLEVCRRTGHSPGRLLMPMSHAATFGGMCSLIGTSTNLVTHEFARTQGLPGFSMFELGKVGLPMALLGSIYILFIGRHWLPSNQKIEADDLPQADDYLTELIVQENSPWIGREVNAERIQHDYEVELVKLVRAGKVISLEPPRPNYQAGDSLRIRGPLDEVLLLAAAEGLELHRPESPNATPSQEPEESEANNATEANADAEKLLLAEVVVLIASGLVGRTLKQVRFAERYNTIVLALRRRGNLRARPSTTPLRAGDVLLVEGTPAALKTLSETRGFLVIGTPERPEQRPGQLLITVLTMVGVIALAAFGVLPIVTAAVAGCAVLMLTGSLRPREAYQAIDLSLVFMLAGTLALGVALAKTGIPSLLAQGLTTLTTTTGPYLLVASFFFVALGISEFMSNSGTVALLGPVVIASATQSGLNPMPLLVAICLGASAAFAMPMGYQTNLMIYEPGGYRFRDFVVMGIALDVLLAGLALWLIPQFWPLTTQ